MGITQRILAIGSTMAVIAAVVAVTMASQAAADNHAGGCDGITWYGDDTTQLRAAVVTRREPNHLVRQ